MTRGASQHVGKRPLRKVRNKRCGIEPLENRKLLSVASVFELDGNGFTSTTHDWDQVFADNGATPPPFSHALTSIFLTDPSNSSTDDIFTGGGSRDSGGIQQAPWLFTDGKPQAKVDITDAYAAAYIDPTNGHLLFYAG